MANTPAEHSELEHAVAKGVKAAIDADDGWPEVDAFITTLAEQGYQVVKVKPAAIRDERGRLFHYRGRFPAAPTQTVLYEVGG